MDILKVYVSAALRHKAPRNQRKYYFLVCNVFEVDRLQIIIVAKNITVLQLFISRMLKMCAIPQLVSAPL